MAYMQVEMFSQALHMAVGVDVILPQPVKNEIGLESGEKTDQKAEPFKLSPMSSGRPNIRFMFCTACPEAPLIRLSITEVISSLFPCLCKPRTHLLVLTAIFMCTCGASESRVKAAER